MKIVLALSLMCCIMAHHTLGMQSYQNALRMISQKANPVGQSLSTLVQTITHLARVSAGSYIIGICPLFWPLSAIILPMLAWHEDPKGYVKFVETTRPTLVGLSAAFGVATCIYLITHPEKLKALLAKISDQRDSTST
jgi:hypothetical protein